MYPCGPHAAYHHTHTHTHIHGHLLLKQTNFYTTSTDSKTLKWPCSMSHSAKTTLLGPNGLSRCHFFITTPLWCSMLHSIEIYVFMFSPSKIRNHIILFSIECYNDQIQMIYSYIFDIFTRSPFTHLNKICVYFFWDFR